MKIELNYFQLGFHVSPEMYLVFPILKPGGTVNLVRGLNDEDERFVESSDIQPEGELDEDLDDDDDEDDDDDFFEDDDDDEDFEEDVEDEDE